MTNRDHSPSISQNDARDAKSSGGGSGLDLDALEAVARAATPGPWGSNYEHVWAAGYKVGECPWDLTGDRPSKQCFADARHIATFDPPTCLAMLAEIRRLRASMRRSRSSARSAGKAS